MRYLSFLQPVGRRAKIDDLGPSSPVPKCEGPVAPALWFGKVTETGATCRPKTAATRAASTFRRSFFVIKRLAVGAHLNLGMAPIRPHLGFVRHHPLLLRDRFNL